MTQSLLPFTIHPVTLEGRYVRLEPLAESHVPGLAAVGLDEEIWQLMIYGQMKTEDDLRAWVLDLLGRQAKGTDVPFAVIHYPTGQVAGATRFMDIRPEHRGLEIGGTWYGKDFRRTVVNSESKYLLLKHAFETLGCIRVQFKTDLRNVRSQRAIERLGAIREGVLRDHIITPEGYRRSSVYYSILDTEWPAVRKRLEAWLDQSSSQSSPPVVKEPNR